MATYAFHKFIKEKVNRAWRLTVTIPTSGGGGSIRQEMEISSS
jgi:hypothetical protein